MSTHVPAMTTLGDENYYFCSVNHVVTTMPPRARNWNEGREEEEEEEEEEEFETEPARGSRDPQAFETVASYLGRQQDEDDGDEESNETKNVPSEAPTDYGSLEGSYERDWDCENLNEAEADLRRNWR